MAERKEYYVENLDVPETPRAGAEPGPWGETAVVGTRIVRVDGYERVSGTAVYPSDVVLPEMLYGAVLRCPHPHATVRSIDTAAAETLPGVHAVLTRASPEATDVRWTYHPQHRLPLFDPRCRYEGETVAAVAAESPQRARDALRTIRVEYEVHPFVSDEREALEDGVAQVHEAGNQRKTDRYHRGDVAAGFDAADATVELAFRTEAEMQVPLELHGCVARWDGDQLILWESTQGVFAVQEQVAHALDLPFSRVRVIGHYVGGGFGSKLQAGKYSVIAALLAKRTARPVKLFLSREETLLCTGNRPAANMTLKAGARRDGSLTALEFQATASGGAYPAGGTVLLDWLVRDHYTCPNVDTETSDLYIHAGPTRPFRAPGHPQCAWALEQTLDALAEELSLDPVALRLANIPTVSQGREGSPPYTTTGLRECIERGAREFGWEEARRRTREQTDPVLRRGVGMGSTLWFAGDGGPPASVAVKLFSDGTVNLNMGASDIGTGTKTIMAQVAAEELGVRPELIQIEHADTATTPYATPSGGSKTVPTEAPTVRAAAISVKRQLLDWAARDLGTTAERLRFRGARIESRDDPSQSLRVTEISQLKKRRVAVGVAHRGPNPEGKVVNPFGAQFCEVEVNRRTGEVRLIRFLAVHDSGRVMNRLTFDSQVYGGITMGIGLACTEFRQLDHGQTGKLVNKNWHDYKLPTALDVPDDIVSSPLDRPDREANASGAKGLGEPVTIPTAAAVANAVYDATGVRVTTTPISPVTLSALLAAHREERPG